MSTFNVSRPNHSKPHNTFKAPTPIGCSIFKEH